MLRFILQKLALIVPTIIGITIASFAFIRLLPGDPILAMASQYGVTPERYEILKHQARRADLLFARRVGAGDDR